MRMNEWVEAQIVAPCKKPLPIMSFPAVQLLGQSVSEMLSDSANQARGMSLLAAEFDTAASVSPMDLSIEAEAFGATLRVATDEVPTIIGELVTDESSVAALAVPAVGVARTGRSIDAVSRAVRLIDDRPVFAGVIGPFSLAGRLMGVSDAMMNCYDEPEMVHALLQKCSSFLLAYIRAFRDVGAHGVLMAEPLAGVLSPVLADEFSACYIRPLISEVQCDDFAFLYHNCGNAVKSQATSIASLGAAGYHFGNAVRLAEMIPLMPANALILGNIDASGQLKNGTPESVRGATLQLLDECAQFTNFIPSSGCDIPPAAPLENLRAFFTAVADFYKQQR